jgi:hypothetical protein
MLVPGDDPPFLTVCLTDATEEFPLRLRQGNELIRRLEAAGGAPGLVPRIFAARAAAFPQRFTARPEDERALLAALEAGPEVTGRLAELREALASRET